MKIVMTNDYRAVPLKTALVAFLEDQGHTVYDVGAQGMKTRDNYVERADAGAAKMKEVNAAFGIFLCGSGTGISIRANKHEGIRAILAETPRTAEYGRKINNANVVCLSGNWLSVDAAQTIVTTFLSTAFEESRRDRVEMLDGPAG